QNRPVLYALQPSLPAPIIPRERCFEVPERLDFAGNVLLALDRDALDRVIDQMVAAEIEAVAVCLLHSYANPIHERAIRDRLLERGFGDEQIALSSQVLPEFREYERASTVSLEAYVRPIMSRYLGHLERQLAVPLRIMKSDGGVMSASVARTSAIQTALSGPAAGVIGAFHVAKLAGFDHVITLDMGGTSTDVSLCPGEPIRHPEREIDGLPLRSRLLDIETIGAGGGSIARLDTGGALRVGPESAGADPGSVIYRRGGTAITVSDANAILGRLDADHFLGGAMRLDIDAARRALAPLANRMGMSLEAAAHGIIQIANVNISGAVRRVSVARGHDPRDFTLVAFGGAGPLHACEVAEGMSIPRVLVPRYPGVLCAFGLLMADIVRDYSRSALTMRPDEWFPTLRTLAAQGRDALRQEGLPEERISVRFHADLRYRGQAYELAVPVEEGQDFIARFHADHEAAYGFALPERAVEVVNLRVTACGAVDKPVLTPSTVEANDASEARIGARLDPLTGAAITLYEREHLRPGARFAGPALVFQLDSTIFVAPGWLAFVDGYLNLVLER
ncbi:MAG TPA: hydantoinase/oxoprolinase family protein, partial [Aggregatilineales bacterium]|nr:hydantoinase/oxoprolinase family protein [Aggregatilineales bacterium]